MADPKFNKESRLTRRVWTMTKMLMLLAIALLAISTSGCCLAGANQFPVAPPTYAPAPVCGCAG